jgi:uncharacterized protein (UPF0335 family)
MTQSEAELVQLRPLKEHLKSLNNDQYRQIEEATRIEHEKNKLTSRLKELEHELASVTTENQELSK